MLSALLPHIKFNHSTFQSELKLHSRQKKNTSMENETMWVSEVMRLFL